MTPAAPGKYPATFANTRTTTPNAESIGAADLKVASFNVLNYFTTLGVSLYHYDANGNKVFDCTHFDDRDRQPDHGQQLPGQRPARRLGRGQTSSASRTRSSRRSTRWTPMSSV